MKVQRLHKKFIRNNTTENQTLYKEAKKEQQKMIRENKKLLLHPTTTDT